MCCARWDLLRLMGFVALYEICCARWEAALVSYLYSHNVEECEGWESCLWWDSNQWPPDSCSLHFNHCAFLSSMWPLKTSLANTKSFKFKEQFSEVKMRLLATYGFMFDTGIICLRQCTRYHVGTSWC